MSNVHTTSKSIWTNFCRKKYVNELHFDGKLYRKRNTLNIKWTERNGIQYGTDRSNKMSLHTPATKIENPFNIWRTTVLCSTPHTTCVYYIVDGTITTEPTKFPSFCTFAKTLYISSSSTIAMHAFCFFVNFVRLKVKQLRHTLRDDVRM